MQKLIDFDTRAEAEAWVKNMGAKYDKTSDPVKWESNKRYYNTPDAHRFEIKEVKADLENFKKGGSIEVELGDEVNEATMQRLKKQGYTFQEI